MSYATHPLAALIPEMTADQFTELRDDIAAHGLLEPIVLHEHMVLDGRHRLRACEETGVEPRFVDFDGPSPVEFVISKNVKRRHFTQTQLAVVGMKFLPAAEEEARQRQVRAGESFGRGIDSSGSPEPELSPKPQRAREAVGRMVGVSGATIDRVRRVSERAPDLMKRVEAGELSVKAADTALRERKPERVVNPIKQHRMPPACDVVPRVLAGLRVHVDELDRALTEGTVKAEEAADWSRDLYAIRTQITGSINHLKERS